MDIANCGKSNEGQQTRVYREARVKRNHLKAIKQKNPNDTALGRQKDVYMHQLVTSMNSMSLNERQRIRNQLDEIENGNDLLAM